MPGIGDALPIGIASEKVKAVISLANRKAVHRAHEASRDKLFAIARETVPLIDKRVANHSVIADFRRARFHFEAKLKGILPSRPL
jgi:hypothetical protein